MTLVIKWLTMEVQQVWSLLYLSPTQESSPVTTISCFSRLSTVAKSQVQGLQSNVQMLSTKFATPQEPSQVDQLHLKSHLLQYFYLTTQAQP